MGDIYIEAVQIENLGEIAEGSTVIEKGFGAVENMSEEEKNRIKDKFLSLINEATEENSEKYGKVYFNSSSLGWEDEYTNKMAYNFIWKKCYSENYRRCYKQRREYFKQTEGY